MALSADKSQRTMMLVLPFIFVPFIINFPAGLVLYWITTNLWTIGQQFAIKKIIPLPVAATPQGLRLRSRPNRRLRRRAKRRSGKGRLRAARGRS